MKISNELVKSLSFFEQFDDRLISLIQPYFEFVSFKPGDVILEQNDFNTKLYYLMEGLLDIYIDDQFIVSISQEGEIFGEMSIAGHTTTTAKVMTKTNSSIVIFDFTEIQNIQGHERCMIEKLIYKSCAEVLARRLLATNEIAKTYRNINKK